MSKILRSSHRTLLKIILNPFLRLLGYSIVSIMSIDSGEFSKYSIRSYPEHCRRNK